MDDANANGKGKTNSPNDLLLTFYGDDFTGSTDVTEVLTLNGISTVLITDPAFIPRARELFPEARAVGLAGVSRSMSPEQMDQSLPQLFGLLKELGAPLFHYKLCSTFDSAPELGSIGHAIELGLRYYTPPIPIVVGAPALKRYQAFGNLFATVDGKTYRLDQHPTMSRHPATPMSESDLRRHLAHQTDRQVGLLDILDLESEPSELVDRFQGKLGEGSELILLDVLDRDHLETIGGLIWRLMHTRDTPLFSASSSGLEYALVEYWQASGAVLTSQETTGFRPVDQIAVVSGSAAPATKAQIDWAEKNGFECIRLNASMMVDPDCEEKERTRALYEALKHLQAGKSVVLYSVRGNDDPALSETRNRLAELGTDPARMGELLGKQLGIIMSALIEGANLSRVCVAGGDTCGHALTQLKVYALEVIAPVAPGSPLCVAHSKQNANQNLEISLKAGQVGTKEYFGLIRDGIPSRD